MLKPANEPEAAAGLWNFLAGEIPAKGVLDYSRGEGSGLGDEIDDHPPVPRQIVGKQKFPSPEVALPLQVQGGISRLSF